MDKYDEAVEFLQKNPHLVNKIWNMPERYNVGCLFQYVAKDGFDARCGCLTQIRSQIKEACTQELTDEIKKDVRIPYRVPVDPDEEFLKKLPVFAEWQRKIDKILGRV